MKKRIEIKKSLVYITLSYMVTCFMIYFYKFKLKVMCIRIF